MARKPSLLSAELSRACAILAGGAPGPAAQAILREWLLSAPERGTNRLPAGLRRWGARLCAVLREAIPLGAPIATLLREAYPMVRSEERHWARMRAIERQFAFQGALAVVLPWAVAGMTDLLRLNGLTAAGGACQAVGLVGFTLLVRAGLRVPRDEAASVLEFATGTWMRVLAGTGLRAALEGALAELDRTPFRAAWLRWLAAVEGGAELAAYEWPRELPESRELAVLLAALLRSGAPSSPALADAIRRLAEENEARLEERIAALPTRLSLVFCGTLAPAMFLIIAGGLWPTFENLWM